jgi:predicted RNA binding protein YcfA (HicA-like mRNA interferase family)
MNALVKKFGFEVTRRKGSHVTLIKYKSERKIVTVVPLHKELKPGTLFGILKLAEISKDEFLEVLS